MSVEPVATTPTLDLPSPLPRTTDEPTVEATVEAAPVSTDPSPAVRAGGSMHVHTRSCYWDFRVAAWVCA